MVFNRLTAATFAFVLGVTGMGMSRGYAAPLGAGSQYGQDRGGWDTPPQELRDIQRQGFRDGIIGAQKDIGNNRQPDPNNRDEYRHPSLPPDQREAYRDGFRRGYERGVAHFTGQDQRGPARGPYGGGPGPGGPGQGGPGMGGPDRGGYDRGGPGPGQIVGQPGPDGGMRLHGFQDGMDGAMKDVGNHRRPDPNNRDEYRSPNVPYGMQDAYRDGFRAGYDRGFRLLTAGPGMDRRWSQGPGMQVRTRGFQDGAEGAIKDFGNNRRPDPNNRDEYRNPMNVPYEWLDPYRDGFQRGYEVAMRELTGFSGRR